MEKSKDLICKTLRLILILLVFIIILETDIFAITRRYIVSKLVFLQGKRTVISNITIGILGSAVLAFLNELIEYRHLKKRQQMKILDICDKWIKNIEYMHPVSIDNIDQVNLIGKVICKYWDDINSTYNEYLPFIRGGLYISIIKTLFDYVNTYKSYFDKMYLKGLYESELNEKQLIADINQKRTRIKEKMIKAEALGFIAKVQSIYEIDKKREYEYELYKGNRNISKLKRERVCLKLKKLSPRNIKRLIEIKRLEEKYKDWDEEQDKQ